jgi:phosphohistidine phosphatase SixA
LIEMIKTRDPDEKAVMLVGHNPTLLDLCILLANEQDAEKLEVAGLPTAALVGLVQPGAQSWAELAPKKSNLIHRFVPKV